jgi:hypothetical protein
MGRKRKMNGNGEAGAWREFAARLKHLCPLAPWSEDEIVAMIQSYGLQGARGILESDRGAAALFELADLLPRGSA